MPLASFFLSTLLLAAAQEPRQVSFLHGIQERWNASDLVCIASADAPQRTGIARLINGARRDQLSANVTFERCLKGEMPRSESRVYGYYVAAAKPGDYGVISFAYSGPPTGFVHNGRNLLFLRTTSNPAEFLVTVPVYQTAIPLADTAPAYPSSDSPTFIKAVLTRELENAMLQSAETGRDTNPMPFADPISSVNEYIAYLFDYLGTPDAIAELSHFSESAPISIQRDIAVKFLFSGQHEYESTVISLLLDETAPASNRWNAALALGHYGSTAALDPLRRIAAQPPQSEDMKILQNYAAQSLQSLTQRLDSFNR